MKMAALSETRFSEQGQLEEVGAGYTFFWSGHLKTEQRDGGAAFVIWDGIVDGLPCLPKGINDRLMSLRPSLRASPSSTPTPQKWPTQRRQIQSSTKTCTPFWRLFRRRTSWASLVTSMPPSGQTALP
ncbi:hypothetical protein SprV_0200879500 [Sparganum proliferum]